MSDERDPLLNGMEDRSKGPQVRVRIVRINEVPTAPTRNGKCSSNKQTNWNSLCIIARSA
jgi:hypothetical protein